MTRIATWLAATAAILVLLLSFPTSHGSDGRPQTVVASGTSTSGTATATSRTVTGQAAQTRYGTVQVQLVVSDGQVVTATAIAYPTGGRDGEISSWAVPQLQDETVTAQSADIDTVSGATFTSEGYISSLQSAIDLAGL